MCSFLELFGATQRYFELFWAMWSYLELFGAILSHLDPFGAILTHFDSFWLILTHLDPLGPILTNFNPFGPGGTPYISRKPLQAPFWQHESLAAMSLGLHMSRPANSPGRSCPAPSNRDEMNWEREVSLSHCPLVKVPHIGRLLCWMGLARYSRHYSGGGGGGREGGPMRGLELIMWPQG